MGTMTAVETQGPLETRAALAFIFEVTKSANTFLILLLLKLKNFFKSTSYNRVRWFV